MTMTPQEILRAAAALVEQPGKWTQGADARDESGRGVFYDVPGAVCFCADGAVWRVGGGPFNRAAKIATRALVTYVGTSNAPAFNDAPGRTAVEVASAMRRAADSLDEHHDTCMCISCLPTPRDDEAET